MLLKEEKSQKSKQKRTKRILQRSRNVHFLHIAFPASRKKLFTFSKMEIKATEILKNVK